jgi:hypothetical protein
MALAPFIWWECLAGAMGVQVVGPLQNTDLSLEVLHRGSRAVTAIMSAVSAASAGASAAAVVFAATIIIRQVELLRVGGLDGPPLAHIVHRCLHHRHEHAAPELVHRVVLGVYAGQLLWCKVASG